MDGKLEAPRANASPLEAQQALLDLVEQETGLSYSADWKRDKPGWWFAELAVREKPE